MTQQTVNLVVKVPQPLRTQAQAIAKLRGETVSDVVRAALKDYVAEALEDSRDNRELDSVVERILAGNEPLREHADVWAEIERLEARGELPD